MMKHLLILVSALFLTQGLKEEEAISRNPTEKYSEELLGPFLKEYFELNNLIEEVKQYQQTQKITSIGLDGRIARIPPHCLPTDTPFVEAWNSDACNNLVNTLEKAVDLAENVIGWGCNAALNISEKFFDLLHCPNINPIAAIKCIINDINEMKEMIQNYKPDVLKFKEDIVAQGKVLKEEFKECLGTQKQAQNIAEQLVLQAQLCDNTKL